MANDRNQERERRIKEMMRRRDNGKNPNEIGILSQGQAEVQSIQDELANELRVQQAQDQARLQTTGVMAQAAEGMLAIEGGGQQLAQQVGNMNQGTQAIMQKYGVKPQNSQKIQTQNFRSSSGAGTMNVRNEYITNNKTDIRITQPQIPLSQPNIRVSAPMPQKTVDNTAKFKTWLSGMFAKQQNEAEIQKKEYRKKEWNLARSTTRLMKRIEDASKNMTARLDPQRMTSTLGGQLKWLLLLFGATMISKVWTPAMKMIANIEGGIRAAFGLPINEELRGNATKGLSIVDNIRAFIGIKPGEKTSLIEGLGLVIKEGVQKLIDKIDFWFEDRSIALREIKFPEMKTPKINIPGMDTLLGGITDSLSGIGQYLGDLITVALGGSKGRVQAAANGIRKQSVATFTDTRGKKTSMGDDELVKGRGRTYMRESDFGVGGVLKGNASSTQAMSRTVTSLMNDRSNTAHTSEIASGVQQLFDVAKRQGQVVIDPEMLSALGLNLVDINQLKQQKDLVQVPYKIIYVKPTEQDLRDNGNLTTFNKTGAGWSGAIAGAGALGYGGAALGSIGGPVGTFIGGAVGGLAGLIGGGIVGYGVGDAVDNKVNEAKLSKGLIAKLVPVNSSETSFDGSPGTPKMMFSLTKKGADAVAARFMSGATNRDMDLTNREFYERIRRIEERRKRQNGVQGALRQNINNNSLREAQAHYEAREREYHNRFESLDPNSQNMQNYGHYNTTVNNVGNAFEGAMEWAGGMMHGVATSLRGGNGKKYCTTSELNKRANYCMKFFMEKGLTKAQAAGIVGNLAKEGLMMQDLGQEIHDVNGPSAGIAMFHDVAGKHGHLSALKEFARERGLNWKDLDTQLQYLWEGSLNGRQIGKSVIDRIRQLQGSYQDVAERASFIWGDKYEVFRGHSNWNDSSHQARRNAAVGLLRRDISDVGYTRYESQPSPTISLSSVGGTTTVSDSGIGEIAWLGDSQTCTAGSAFPKGVASGLGTHIAYFGIVGANAGHYLGANIKGQVRRGTNIEALKNATCAQALQYILQNKPKYCIIALGHNGVGGLQKLINTLGQAGIQVYTIKMWAIDGSRSKMATYSKEDMAKMYNGITSYGWVDLTWVNVEKGSDGVHASPQGCQTAAAETVKQLKTGTMSELDPNREAVSDFGSAVAGALDFVASGFGYNPAVSSQGSLGNITDQMTPEQRVSFEKVTGQISAERSFNTKTWEEMVGAKTNEIGTYVDYNDVLTGNTVRSYLRTSGSHNALDGIKNEDIDWIEVYGKDGKRIEGLSEDYLNTLKKSVMYEKNVIFSEYPIEGGKGDGYNDYMTDDKTGNFLFIYLGKYKDIGNFSKVAQKDFGGGISYYICPSKNCTRTSIIRINKTPCSNTVVGFSEEVRNDNDFDTLGNAWYGPIIFRRGETWKIWGTLPKDKKYTGGWQPICYHNNVRLTPSAENEERKLLQFLFENNDIRHTKNGFERSDGTVLSENEVEFAKQHGLINRGFLGGSIGPSEVLSKVHGQFNKNSRKVETRSFEVLQKTVGGTKEEREKYYNKYKNNFITSDDGFLYDAATKLKFGTVDKDGKIVLYDNSEFEDNYRKDGEVEGLRSNEKIISYQQEKELSDKSGIVSRDFSANLVSQLTNYDRTAKFSIKGKRELGISSVKGTLTFINNNGDKVKIPYTATHFSNGESLYKAIPGKYEGIEVISGNNSSSSLEGLKDLLIKTGHDRISYAKGRGGFNDRTDLRVEEMRNSFFKNLLNKGLTIIEKEEGGYYKLSDGSRVNPGFKLTEEDIARFNKSSEFRQSQIRESETIRLYGESNLGKQHQSLIEKANKDIENIKTDGNGYAVDASGAIYGKVVTDESGKAVRVEKLSSSRDIQRSAVEPIDSNPYLRYAYYKEAYGLKNMGYGSTRGEYKEIEHDGKKYYVKVNTDTDLSSLINQGWTAAGNRNEIYTLNDSGTLVNANIDDKTFAAIDNGMKNMVEAQGLTKTAIDLLTDRNIQAAAEAAKQRAEQEKAIIDQKTAVEKQEIYLKAQTEALEKLAEIDPEGTKNKIMEAEERGKQAKAEVDEKTRASLTKTNYTGPVSNEGESGFKFGWHKSGGFTATGDSDDEVAGIVHRNEWVASASLTRKYKPFFELLDKYQNPEVNKIDINAPETKTPNSESAPSYVNTGGNVINSGNTTIINNGGGGEYGGRRNTLSGTCTNDFGYNSSVGGKNRVNGGH